MLRYCFTLDLKDAPEMIAEYEEHHKRVWPEILESIKSAGIEVMQIYRWSNRLFMIMEVDNSFSFSEKARNDAANPKVQEWENIMWKYQQALPGTIDGAKWQRMDKIFGL